jgi:halocyanin-like protein
MTRRSLLTRSAGVATAGAVGTAASGSASAQGSAYGGYLSDASNFEGETADATGMEEVTIEVGAGTTGLLFDPAAIVVEPGTTITWEWTGNGGGHNVVSAESSGAEFRSGDPVDSGSETFSQTFSGSNTGTHPYFCSPHRGSGMKGVVVVGSENVQGDTYPFGQVEETLNSVAVFGGAAVFGTTALLGLSAYREMFGDDDQEH